jgi:cobalamin 5'-phosphate synthase/cobalamin synthase
MRAALAFLTPLGGARRPTPRATAWFPTAGMLIGAAVGGVWWAAWWAWPPLVAGGVAVAADAGLTGLLHLDGLVDSADGLLPHLDRQRRLAVMAEPRAGAFGVAVIAVVVILRTGALASVHPDLRLTAALWCGSRTCMALTMGAVPYARGGGGLAAAFSGGGRWTALYGLAAAGALAAWWHPVRGPVAVAAGVAAAAAVVGFAWRRVGGYTGDVLGAAGVIAETVGLLVAAARR